MYPDKRQLSKYEKDRSRIFSISKLPQLKYINLGTMLFFVLAGETETISNLVVLIHHQKEIIKSSDSIQTHLITSSLPQPHQAGSTMRKQHI